MTPLIPRDLCTRCGACFGADKSGRLSKDELGFPVYDDNKKQDVDDLLQVCSGENWNYRRLLEQEYGPSVKYDPSSPDIGVHRAIYLVSANDDAVRERGQSGGVTTALLTHAMDTGLIDAALVVRRPEASNGNPFASEPYIAKSPSNLLDSCGSKYTICSTLEMVPEISAQSDKFAMTLLPCQTVGFKRMVSDFDPSLKEKCKLIIGPYCGLNMEAEAGSALAAAARVEPSKVRSFKNRGGSFPGATTFKLKSGGKHFVDRTAHRILYRMYSPIRCYTCTDYGNELADLVVADCWLQQKRGQFDYPEGAAYVICRSERGEQIVKEALIKGNLVAHNCDVELAKRLWKPSFTHRKVRAHNRIRYWSKRGRAVPKPDYKMPAEFIDSRMADQIEMRLWSFFRCRWICKKALFIWLWLAKASVGSFKNLIFEDCKIYMFTHLHDQYTGENFKSSLAKYKQAIRGKISSCRNKIFRR